MRKPTGKGYVFQRVRKNSAGQVEKDPSWTYRFTVGGQLFTRSGFSSKREAELAYYRARNEEGASTRRTSTRFSFGTAIELYLKDLRTRTSDPYRIKLFERLQQRWGKKPLVSVKTIDIDQYRIERSQHTVARGGPIRPTTVNRELNYIRAFFFWAIQREMLPVGANPAVGSKITRAPEVSDTRDITEDELKRALAYLGERHRPWALLAWYLGLRIGDIHALRWEDVSFERGEIRAWVQKTKQRITIPINGAVTEILQGLGPQASGRILWEKREGLPGREWRRACKKAGLDPRINRHSIRRGFATDTHSKGATITTVQELGGWKTPDMALRYIRSSDQAKRQAVEARGRIEFIGSGVSKLKSEVESEPIKPAPKAGENA